MSGVLLEAIIEFLATDLHSHASKFCWQSAEKKSKNLSVSIESPVWVATTSTNNMQAKLVGLDDCLIIIFSGNQYSIIVFEGFFDISDFEGELAMDFIWEWIRYAVC